MAKARVNPGFAKTKLDVVPQARNRKLVNSFRTLSSTSGGITTRDPAVGKVTIRTVKTNLPWFGGTTISPYLTLPYAPASVRVSDISDSYEEISRPGRRPLVFRSESRNKKIELTSLFTAADNKGTASAELSILWLQYISQTDEDLLIVGMGDLTRSSKFRITDLSVNAQRLNPSQQITIAEVTIAFVEVPFDQNQPTIPGMSVIADIPPLGTNGYGADGGSRTSNSNPWDAAAPYWVQS